MSQEQAKKFIERMKTDEVLEAKIIAVTGVAERLAWAELKGMTSP